MMRRPESCSMFFIHLFAWPCGSIINGHRRATEVTMPLSIEKESVGNPCIFQPRILTGSPTISCKSNLSEEGRRLSLHNFIHSEIASRRYSIVNGPRYAITPEDRRTSPRRLLYRGPSDADISDHRVLSPPKPPMSFSARSSFVSQSAYFASNSPFVFASCSSLASIAASLSSTSLSSARFALRPFIASSYSASAARSISFLGATTFATRS
mmetsp:Transcript_25019/g.61993  ORF Transcript_25019/g.61993 Transcript_25019/m.61993 type:complete len:211 (-) Transcript_25019:193-825(-)